jgi:hypothetical protein
MSTNLRCHELFLNFNMGWQILVKPECVLSFNMGWRILVNFTNIHQPMLKLKTHSGFNELFRF